MKYVVRTILLLVSLPAIAGYSAVLSNKQELSIAPALAARVQADPDGTEYSVLVRLSDHGASADKLAALAQSSPTLHDRYARVGAQLRGSRASSFEPSGKSTIIRRFWIANTVEMRVDKSALLELAQRDDVLIVAPNVPIELLEPVSVLDAVSATAGAASNLQAVGARALWARGLTGRGRVVASIDTGVEGVHPALAERWRGKNGDTAASWFDPLNGAVPVDNNGHGTHVMGIMVGRDGADTIGLAPDAEWICAAVVDRGRSLSATFADILAALQWVVDPDGNPQTMDDVPDVVCNSWGVSQEIINPCDKLFFEAIDNVEAMGVVCVFAAGNEGPNSMSIRNPADRATSPTASFSVGAVDASSTEFTVPAFSSRGPSACDGIAKKPEIAAPGVAIRSAYKGQTYRLINGTSMAAPHVAAAVALLRQHDPELTPEEIKTALLATAHDIGTPGEDNASGRGLLDLEAAIASLPVAGRPEVYTGQVALQAGPDGVAALGEDVQLVVPIAVEVANANDVTLHLSAISAHASVVNSESYIGSVAAGMVGSNESSPFIVTVSPEAQAGDSAQFEVRISGETSLDWWRDTVAVMIGLPTGASVVTVSNGPASLTVSNFGQIGLAGGSALNAGGSGWRTDFIDANILYAGELVVSSADGGWSDASRREDDGTLQFDFLPQQDPGGELCFTDAHSVSPVGVEIVQRVQPVYRSDSYEITSVSWTVRNTHGSTINALQLAWLTDIDLPGVGVIQESVDLDVVTGGFFHTAIHGGVVAGVTPLSGPFASLSFIDQSAAKALPSTTAKRAALNGFHNPPEGISDYLAMYSSAPLDIDAGDSVVIAVAFITAADPGSFSSAGVDARNRWLAIADVDDDQGGVRPPVDYTLGQNYPNPFNAGTTIPVSIAGDGSRLARLDIFDLLGRRVRTLLNENEEPGNHAIYWDGRTDNGQPVASGVYFARLLVGGKAQQVRSMVLIK